MNLHHPHAECIAFVHNKGGTGKTTACLNVAGWLAKMRQKVLVIDLDPKGNATQGLGIAIGNVEETLFDVKREEASVEDIIVETSTNLYLMPGSEALVHLENELRQSSENDDLFFLSHLLQELQPYFNYILIDVPPSINTLMLNGIVAANSIIIPIDSGVFGIESLNGFFSLIKEVSKEIGQQIKIKSILLKAFSHSIMDLWTTQKMRNLAIHFCKEEGIEKSKIKTIPFSKKIGDAQWFGLPISHYAPYSEAADAFKKVALLLLSEKH